MAVTTASYMSCIYANANPYSMHDAVTLRVDCYAAVLLMLSRVLIQSMPHFVLSETPFDGVSGGKHVVTLV